MLGARSGLSTSWINLATLHYVRMFKFLNLQPEVFGIDINDLSLRIVRLEKKRKGFNLVSFGEAEIKPGIVKEGVIQDQEALAKIIRFAFSTVKGKKLSTKYIIACLPEEKSFAQVIQMPKMTMEELQSSVPFEAENYIPLSIDKVYWDFQIINSHEDKENLEHLDLLVSMMPRSIVDAYVNCFKKAGLIPFVLEVESQAIVRALLNSGEGAAPIIFIDFGQTKTSFIIFAGNSIRFTSSISFSSRHLTEAISDTLGISFYEAEKLKIKYGLITEQKKNYNITKIVSPVLNELIDQIKKYMNFYYGHTSHGYFSSDNKIGKIILCGGGANLQGLPDFLYKELKIPVELGNPLINIVVPKRFQVNPLFSQKISSFTTALGLAIRGASEEA